MQIRITTENIFDMPATENCAVCVTTNGVVKRNGFAVMGKGIAKEANERFHCSGRLGVLLTQSGNHVYDLGAVTTTGPAYRLIAYPTKNDWKNDSIPALVKQSAHELVALCDRMGIQTCYLPPVGCGVGHLDWNGLVRPMLERILDDRFIAVLRP